MDRIISDAAKRKLFIPLVVLLVFALQVGRNSYENTIANPDTTKWNNLDRFISGNAERLSSGLLLAIVIALFIWWAERPVKEAAEEIQIVPANQITNLFKDSFSPTYSWHFKGGLGRYYTSATVPGVLASGKTGLAFSAAIVDPRNHVLCKHVADLREEHPASIAHEAFATAVDFVRLVALGRSQILSAKLSLIDDFTPMRIDVSDIGMILTHDGPTAAALHAPKQTPFFDGYRHELTTGPNSYDWVDIRAAADRLTTESIPVTRKDVRVEFVKDVVAALQAGPEGFVFTIPDSDLPSILAVIHKRKNPYG